MVGAVVQRRIALPFAVLVAIVFHFGFMIQHPRHEEADTASYLTPARNLVRSGELRAPDRIANAIAHSDGEPRPEAPDTLRTPGYPLFLALFLLAGLPLTAAVFIQHVIAVAMTAALYLFVEHVLKKPAAALIASVLFAEHPATVEAADRLMSDLLAAAFALATMIAVYALIARRQQRWAIVAGILVGCLTLIRPIGVFLFIPLALVIVTSTRRVVLTAVFVAASLILPAAWMWRNERATGVATVSSIAGENMLFFRAAGALAVHGKGPLFGMFALQRQSGFYRPVLMIRPALRDEALALARREGKDPHALPHAQLSRYYLRRGSEIVLAHPLETAELAFSALVEMFIGLYLTPAISGGVAGDPFVWVALAAAMAIVAAAVTGAVVTWRDSRPLFWIVVVMVAYFSLMAAGAEGWTRFAVPYAPAYAIAAAVGIDYVIERRRFSAPAATEAAALRR